MGCVYLATNKINGKSYVGKTIRCLEDRMYEHKLSSLEPFYPFTKAIKKYGLENFEWCEVYTDIPEDKLDELEIECIKWFNTRVPNGYNLTNGGGGVLNYKHSEDALKRISDALKGVPKSEDHKNKMSLSRLGKKQTEEHRRRISEGHKGRTSGMKGKKHTEEALKKMSNAHKGNPSWSGKKHSEETKKRMSASAKAHQEKKRQCVGQVNK